MSKQTTLIARGENFKALDLGGWEEIAQYVTGPFQGKVFLKEAAELSGSEISVGALPPSAALPFFHSHKQNEEVYIVLRGGGEMQVDGKTFPLKEGSVVRVSPAGMRSLKSGAEGMSYLCIQTKAGSLSQWTGDDGVISQQPWEK